MGKHGGGPSNTPRGGAGSGARSPDQRPFTQSEFEQAQLTKLTGAGGHMRVYRTTMGGKDYFVKSFQGVDNDHERPEHDIAARAIAKAVGLEHYTLPAYAATRGGESFVVQPFVHGETLSSLVRNGGLSRLAAFHLIPEDVRHLMEVAFYAMGERDRTAANFRADASQHVYGIDFTRAFTRQTALYTEQSGLEKWGIGKGAKVPFGTEAIPRAALAQVTRARGAILAAVHRAGVDPARAAAVKARLDILDRVLARHPQPVYNDIIDEAYWYGPQGFQRVYEWPWRRDQP